MSCGDCDWGCVAPDCGAKMSYCAKHYIALETEIKALRVARDELPSVCARCGGWRPKPGFEHVISTDDLEGVTCRLAFER